MASGYNRDHRAAASQGSDMMIDLARQCPALSCVYSAVSDGRSIEHCTLRLFVTFGIETEGLGYAKALLQPCLIVVDWLPISKTSPSCGKDSEKETAG